MVIPTPSAESHPSVHDLDLRPVLIVSWARDPILGTEKALFHDWGRRLSPAGCEQVSLLSPLKREAPVRTRGTDARSRTRNSRETEPEPCGDQTWHLICTLDLLSWASYISLLLLLSF